MFSLHSLNIELNVLKVNGFIALLSFKTKSFFVFQSCPMNRYQLNFVKYQYFSQLHLMGWINCLHGEVELNRSIDDVKYISNGTDTNHYILDITVVSQHMQVIKSVVTAFLSKCS